MSAFIYVCPKFPNKGILYISFPFVICPFNCLLLQKMILLFYFNRKTCLFAIVVDYFNLYLHKSNLPKKEKTVMRKFIYIFCCNMFALVALLSSCSGGNSVDHRSMSEWCREMDDSLKSMNINFVRSAVDDKLSDYASADKDIYYMALMQKAKLFSYTSNRDSILPLCDSVQHYLDSTMPTDDHRYLQMMCFQVRANYYAKFTLNIDSVISCNEKALRIAREIADPYHEVILCNNIGDAYISCGDLVRAVDYFRRAVFIGDSTSVPQSEMAMLY